MKKRQNHGLHRKVWIKHNGPIPYGSDGYRYEIHHIDGNADNNDIANLIALTIWEHYEIHYWQGDWAACQSMILRMNVSPEERSKLASEMAKKRIKNGTHPFTDPVVMAANAKRASEAVGDKNSMYGKSHTPSTRKQMKDSHDASVAAGTHHTLTAKFAETSRQQQNNLLKQNKHNFQKDEIREAALKVHIDMLSKGTHPLQAGNRIDPNKIMVSCLICKRPTSITSLATGHKHEATSQPDNTQKNHRKVCCIVCGGTTNVRRLFKDHLHDD